MGAIGEQGGSYPVVVFAGVLVKLMESHLGVQFVGVRLQNIKRRFKSKRFDEMKGLNCAQKVPFLFLPPV